MMDPVRPSPFPFPANWTARRCPRRMTRMIPASWPAAHDPGMLLRMLPGISNNSCCTADEQPSEIAISLLGNAAEPLLASRRVLPRHEPDPCCKIPAGFEVTRVCDSGSDRRSSDHAYPRYSLEAAARIIGTMMGVNGPIQNPDLQFERGELIDNGL